MDNLLANGGSQRTFPSEEWELQGKMLGNLSADLLATVFSYLCQRELFEVMLVGKHWDMTAREDRSLWSRVEVARPWILGDIGRERGRAADGAGAKNMASRLLGAAKEVRFFCEGQHNIPMSVMGMLGQELRSLDFPYYSLHPACFSSLLSQLPNLECLAVRGEPSGEDPIIISHSNLKTFKVNRQQPRSLTIDCPNLTYLSTVGDGSVRDMI